MKLKIILPLLTLVFFHSCQMTSQELEKSILLEDKNNAKLSLEMERKGFFVNNITGTANGPMLFQRMGSLDQVVKSFSGKKDVQVEGISSKSVFKITVEDYPSEQVASLETDILDFMAEEVGFTWTIEKQSAEFHSVKVTNYELFKDKANREAQNGTTKMIKLIGKKLNYYGPFNELVEVIEENMPEANFLFELPRVDFKVDMELSLKSLSALETTLRPYGISLTSEMGERESILIQAN